MWKMIFRFPAFLLKFFQNFAINLTVPETFPKNAKPWKSVRAFWIYSVRKENPTYFYYISIVQKSILYYIEHSYYIYRMFYPVLLLDCEGQIGGHSIYNTDA